MLTSKDGNRFSKQAKFLLNDIVIREQIYERKANDLDHSEK